LIYNPKVEALMLLERPVAHHLQHSQYRGKYPCTIHREGKVIACVHSQLEELVMLILRRLRCAILLIIFGLSLPAALIAQQTPPPTRLALEVTFYPGRKPAYQNVPAGKAQGAWYALFGRISSWRLPVEARATKAVRIVPSVEGDGVRIVVSLLSGEKAHENEEQVASYLIRENEKISADELRQFGIEPFGIKLVRVAPTITPVPPVILKAVTSIVVLNAVAVEATLPTYKITLFNQSGKNIVGLAVDVVTGDKIEISARPREPYGEPLVMAGKNYELKVHGPVRAREIPGGLEPTTLSNTQILITTAVFDDGTYEGDAENAAIIRAFRAGEKMELPRLIARLDTALNSPLNDVAASLLRIRMEVAAASSDADSDLVQGLVSEFPQLGKPAKERIKQAMEISSAMTKADLIKEIRRMQTEPMLSADSYRDWLRGKREKYAQWLARL
jgi:hypothetical protein